MDSWIKWAGWTDGTTAGTNDNIWGLQSTGIGALQQAQDAQQKVLEWAMKTAYAEQYEKLQKQAPAPIIYGVDCTRKPETNLAWLNRRVDEMRVSL